MNKQLLYAFENRILILDGAMGTMIQKKKLTEADYRGEIFKNHHRNLKGNNDVLSLTKPEIIKEIHCDYLKAGADIITCNTFSSTKISQKEYGLENYVKKMNENAVKIAKEVVNKFSTKEKPRFIAASFGPTNKTASISSDVENPQARDVTFDELVLNYKEQAEIFIDNDVDILLLETIFDTLNAKSAIYAIKETLKEKNKDIPLVISATLSDKSGRILSGQNLSAFYTSIEYAKPLCVGLNCALGIDEMIPHIEELSNIASCGISLYANAGLPNAFGEYTDTPEIMARGYRYLAENKCINICGGCCGTTPKHIEKISDTLKNCKPKKILNKNKKPMFSGLESFSINDKQKFAVVAERTNVTGSKKFATLIKEKNYKEALNIARHQIEAGANIIDISLDMPLIDVKTQMTDFLNLIASEPEIAKVPIMIDSSDFNVIEAALKCLQGKSIVNSISLKEGEEKFIRYAKKIKDYGACPVVMAFDEKGQANTTARRLEIIDRAYKILVEKLDYKPTDILFDLNVFPLATGMIEHNINAVSFIEATKIIKTKYPNVTIIGGISNISFSFRGLNKIREAMHTIFLHYAINAGLEMGIVNPSALETYDSIEEPLKTLVENLVLNKSNDAGEKLLEYAQSMDKDEENKKDKTKINIKRKGNVEERLQYALIKGDSEFLNDDLDEALKKYTPLDIIEKVLMDGMNKIGVLFGDGKMFLPQVVKSARIMKITVDYLKKYLKQNESDGKIGKIVLATVKADVHDIGKNILSLILTCNNFEVIDLGVMVNCKDILESAKNEKADIIALSGLITPSLDEMIYVAKQMEHEGFDLPALMVGGATTSELHTAIKIAPNYHGIVAHTKDASQVVTVAKKIIEKDNDFINNLKNEQRRLFEKYEQ